MIYTNNTDLDVNVAEDLPADANVPVLGVGLILDREPGLVDPVVVLNGVWSVLVLVNVDPKLVPGLGILLVSGPVVEESVATSDEVHGVSNMPKSVRIHVHTESKF